MLPEKVQRREGIATLGNEFATIQLSIDKEANDPRLRIESLRDQRERIFDPMALALLCHADDTVMVLLADLARDPGAGVELAAWLAERRDRRPEGDA